MNQEIKGALIRVLPFVVVLLLLAVAMRRRRFHPHVLDLRTPLSAMHFLLWTVGFLTFALLIELAFYKCGILKVSRWHHPLFSSIIRITGAVILAPVVEELVFRGLLLNALMKRKLNLHLAIFIQAVIFVLLHHFTWEHTLASNIGIVQGLIDASLFGYARYHTRSLYTPVTMHATGNLIATLERFIL